MSVTKTRAILLVSFLGAGLMPGCGGGGGGSASGGDSPKKDGGAGGSLSSGGRTGGSGGVAGSEVGPSGGALGVSGGVGGDSGSSGGADATGGGASGGDRAGQGGRGGRGGATATGGVAGMTVCGSAGGPAAPLAVIDTSVQKQTGFDNGAVAPYFICTTQNPNYGRVAVVDGRSAAKFYWTQVGYDGTRTDRGAEACSNLEFTKDGWYGFQFYLPSPGFPTDKTEGIAQIFSNGGCSSWASMLQVRGNELWIEHRGNCVAPAQYQMRLATDVPRNTWNSIIIHFTASHLQAGGAEVWFGPATCAPGAPTYTKVGINFGFGTWAGDALAAGTANAIGLKFGMYNFDDANYTAGETRTIYYDNVIQLIGNPTDAWTRVNPNNR